MFDFPRAKQVLVRLVLALSAFLGAVQIFRLGLLPAIQYVFRPGEALTSVLRRIGIMFFAVFGYWAYVHFIEKRPVRELRPMPIGIVVGGLTGASLILFAMLLLFAGGVYVTTGFQGLQEDLWGVAGLILIAALLEEIFYRGILFRIFETGMGTMRAMWLQALIFSLMHIANVEDRASLQEIATTVVSGLLLGALWTLVFVYSRNLWVTAANHAAWNFTIILAGLPLSGLEDWRGLALFTSEYNGPSWLTGGVFGPEDSMLTMLLVALALAWLHCLARAQQRLVLAPAHALYAPGNRAGLCRHVFGRRAERMRLPDAGARDVRR